MINYEPKAVHPSIVIRTVNNAMKALNLFLIKIIDESTELCSKISYSIAKTIRNYIQSKVAPFLGGNITTLNNGSLLLPPI